MFVPPINWYWLWCNLLISTGRCSFYIWHWCILYLKWVQFCKIVYSCQLFIRKKLWSWTLMHKLDSYILPKVQQLCIMPHQFLCNSHKSEPDHLSINYYVLVFKLKVITKHLTYGFRIFRSPESLGWPISMGWHPLWCNVRCALRTTGPIFTKSGM